jgi:phenylacetate-CoA ligase
MEPALRQVPVAHPAVTRAAWADIETADPADVMAQEQALLRDQLALTVATSEFYRSKWAEAAVDPVRVADVDDLARLPFTEKHELQAAQAARRPFGTNQAAPPDRLVRMQATGGTTGSPLRMAMTRSDIAVYNEVGARAAWAGGLRPGDILFECMNYSLYAGGVNDHGTFETLGACVAPVGVGQSRRLVEILSDLGAPAVLYATPSYALHLAKVAREEGREPRDLGLRRGLFSGDAGLANPGYRAEIEQTWGLVARSIYGTGETAPVAAECEAADGLHWVGQGAFLAEFIDPDSGDVVQPADGATAELVITTLRREAHPLIRFRTHDHVRMATGLCSCGRTSLRFHILGRSDDMFIVRGINVFPLAVAAIVDEFRPDLSGEFRIVLEEPPPLVAPPRLRVEGTPGVPAERLAETANVLAARIRAVLVFTPNVEVVPAGTFPRGEQKTKRVVRAWLGET